MSSDLSSDESDEYFQDELLESSGKFTPDFDTPTAVRQVRLILDHTAFVRGIGNIKRWFNEEYINVNATRSNEVIHLSIYVPSYTLHEFDFVKKGTSITATNAREAIRFIDNYLENEVETTSKKIVYDLLLESPKDNTPSWNKCLKYKVHSPKIKEFPNYRTKFDSSLIGQTPVSGNANNENELDFIENFDNTLSFQQRNRLNDIQYENSPSYQNAAAHSDEFAEMPVRLRYLIRTCIYKRFIEQARPKPQNELEEWKLVTEDSIAKIWAKSFGIDCVNVNEAELLIFQNYDVNLFRLYNPYANDKDNFDPSTSILQNTIDTTLYSYSTAHQDTPKVEFKKKRRRGRKGKRRQDEGRSVPLSTAAVVHSAKNESGTGIIKKENFGAINYAPRGQGQLWRPG
ncbi:Nonsense-mediated decay protein 4 [Candida viswanathii]|uniref:Nonsense-mediated decay protein 4 n=1 Tax=Candida viswanathii TaxID=5486 RepID=A0A367XNS4_9ASCO|nr:Nonsense-mediated decay protein 4 [Candida viswanathii]